MASIVERRPVVFTLGFGAAMVAVTVIARVTLSALFPRLTLQGIGLILNWVFVALIVGLVAWLGWWGKIRLMAPVNRRALIYLLPFAVMVFIPFAFGLAIPEISLIEGTVLPPWAAVVVIVIGVAFGAAVAEELLFRGVLLRALESRGRVLAVVLPSVVFGLSHVSQVILGNSFAEWLPQMILIIPLGVGLGAVALRLESLWPLVLWHFAVDVTGGLAASPSAVMELVTVGLIFVVFAVGVGLLQRDRKVRQARVPVQAEVSS